MTVHEVGERLNVSDQTVRNWLSKGYRGFVLDSYTVGRRREISEKAIQDWLVRTNGGRAPDLKADALSQEAARAFNRSMGLRD